MSENDIQQTYPKEYACAIGVTNEADGSQLSNEDLTQILNDF